MDPKGERRKERTVRVACERERGWVVEIGKKNERDKKRGDWFERCRSVRIESQAASCKH